MTDYLPLYMFIITIAFLMLGYPAAFTLGGMALLFGIPTLGISIFQLLPLRIYGIMTNFTLLAVPLFIFMGVILEKSGVANDLLKNLSNLFGSFKGGLAVAVVSVGALLGATTGVVGATVITLGIIAFPIMLRNNYDKSLSAGIIATSGTLGQVIPPSIVLILLADIAGVPVGKLFLAAIIPSVCLITGYILYIVIKAKFISPNDFGNIGGLEKRPNIRKALISIIPSLALITIVLGSIILGIASPTESGALGCLGAIILSLIKKRFEFKKFFEAARYTATLTSMVFIILIGATAFSLVFKGLGGDSLLRSTLTDLEAGKFVFILTSMLLIFLLGFFLDFIEISFILVPILVPIASFLDINLVWFTLLIAVNLQTSFLTPPFGFSIFYLKSVAPDCVTTIDIYKGVIPFICIQILVLSLLLLFPDTVTWLPEKIGP